jgi:hypothetical protein
MKTFIACFFSLLLVFCIPPFAFAADAISVPSALNARLIALEGSVASNGNVLALNAATNAINTRLGTAETTLATATGNVAAVQSTLASATGNVATLQGLMTTTTGNVATVQSTLASATGNVATLQGEIVALADTNVTTTARTYTPRFVGDVLVGGAGVGTNAVWIAKGATSNDWVAIKP